jgi:hypothetical protein
MKLLYRCCAGMDVYQKSASVCIRRRRRGQPELDVEEATLLNFHSGSGTVPPMA